MKLIYLTSQKYLSKKVEPFFIKSMATAFVEILNKDFVFLVRGDIPEKLKSLNPVSINAPWRLRTVSYFFRLPILIFKNGWNDSEVIFFSSDPYLLSILIFWRKLIRSNYLVCSDWHQLFEDWRDRYVAKNSDYLVSTSKRLKKLLSDRCKIDPQKIIVAYGGVDLNFSKKPELLNREEEKKELGLPGNVFLVGYVGGFTSAGQEKGISLMIKSLNYLDKEVVMVFVGGSKKEVDKYFVLAGIEKVEDRCIFVERQPFEKVVAYERVLDVLVIPYPDKKHFRDYGFPMKVWEYMASGRPIIYSDLEIMGEILKEKATAFLPDSPRSLAEAIKSIHFGLGLAETQARLNLDIVQSYTWRARAENIINFLSQ